MKVYINTISNNRKTKVNFLREFVKNILSRSPLTKEVEKEQITFWNKEKVKTSVETTHHKNLTSPRNGGPWVSSSSTGIPLPRGRWTYTSYSPIDYRTGIPLPVSSSRRAPTVWWSTRTTSPPTWSPYLPTFTMSEGLILREIVTKIEVLPCSSIVVFGPHSSHLVSHPRKRPPSSRIPQIPEGSCPESRKLLTSSQTLSLLTTTPGERIEKVVSSLDPELNPFPHHLRSTKEWKTNTSRTQRHQIP